MTDFTSIFSPFDFKERMEQFWVISKMDKCNSLEIDEINWLNRQKSD